MKKKSFIILVLLFFISRLFSMDFSLLHLENFANKSEKIKDSNETKSFSIEITPSFGMMFGRASEYVYLQYSYYQGVNNYNPKLSQLDYEYSFPYFSLNVDTTLFHYLYLGGNLSVGIPFECGIMQDYDWINSYYPNHEWTNELTNYSIHQNFIDSYFDFKFCIGANLNISNVITIVPLVGLGFDSIQFSAFNGKCKYGIVKDGIYTPISLENQEFNLDGKDIIYAQYSSDVKGGSFIQFNLGLKYILDFIPRIKVLGSFLFYPFYTISSYDYHIRTNTEYLSLVKHSFKFSTNLQISFDFNNFLSAGLFGEFDIVPLLRGVSYSKFAYSNSAYSYANNCQSGIERISGKVSLVLRLSF